jgi:N-methylhydantoinase A/oxoprolinase/acetone carboxylase beta subunit
MYKVAIDVGGTFTDCLVLDGGRLLSQFKIDACRPYEMKLKATFPPLFDVSKELRAKLKAKFSDVFLKAT